MGRKRRKGGAEELVDLVASLPWWVGILLGVVSFVVLDRVSRIVPAPLAPGQTGSYVVSAMLIGVAQIGKFVVPFLCAVAALVSLLRRRKRNTLFNGAEAGGASAIAGMSWLEFEAFVGEVLHRRGYSVTENFDGGPDGGFDLLLRREGELALVQCKHWKSSKVGVSIVRELYGVMATRGAARGFVVTSGAFTSEARTFAKGCGVELWDGGTLSELLKGNPQPAVPAPVTVPVAASGAAVPTCPTCGSGMVQRTAKTGAHAGKVFWGCSRFPACRDTRSVNVRRFAPFNRQGR